uniref:HTH La-type RNA-binding domain-containing protein n=1 Tax=Panagrolaimus superbus TaxID=310955 RepID=A0A914XXX3_9BILA
MNAKLIDQVEHYLGNENLSHDKFFRDEMKKDHGWIPPLTFFLDAMLLKELPEIRQLSRQHWKIAILLMSQMMDKKFVVILKKPLPENMPQYWHELKCRTVFIVSFQTGFKTIYPKWGRGDTAAYVEQENPDFCMTTFMNIPYKGTQQAKK